MYGLDFLEILIWMCLDLIIDKIELCFGRRRGGDFGERRAYIRNTIVIIMSSNDHAYIY